MTEHDDPLWNPGRPGDAELQRMQALLAPYRLGARGLGEWTPAQTAPPRRYRRTARLIAAAVAASVLLYIGFVYRLAWSDGQPWRIVGEQGRGVAVSRSIAPGDALETAAQESVTIAVARIGQITLSPESSFRLIETRTGAHRVGLDRGHLRARIWAPPGYFRVSDAASEVVDLGCDFDLWKQGDGSGRVHVRSGWVSYRVGLDDVLVPAGFTLRFDGNGPSTPMRPEADAEFVRAVQGLERTLVESGPSSTAARAASEVVARASKDTDAFTLLSLLSQHPSLAEGALYPRLARALKTRADDATHRADWAAGNRVAIDAWWEKFPTQPKRWWVHWADALPG